MITTIFLLTGLPEALSLQPILRVIHDARWLGILLLIMLNDELLMRATLLHKILARRIPSPADDDEWLHYGLQISRCK